MLDFARKRGIAIISDEVYGTIIYDGSKHAPSFLEIAEPDDNLFVINTFSKPWAMTGWRIGWLVHPESLDEQMKVICIANNTGPTSFAQYGALAALSPEGDAFRGEMLERCRDGPRHRAEIHRRPEPHPLDAAGGRVLRLPSCRRHEGQLEFRQRSGAQGARRRGAGLAFGPPDDIRDDFYFGIRFAQDAKRLADGLRQIGDVYLAPVLAGN